MTKASLQTRVALLGSLAAGLLVLPLLLVSASASISACSSSTTAATTPDGGTDTPDSDSPPPAKIDSSVDPGTEDSAPPADPLAGCTRDPGGMAAAFDAGASEDPIGATSFTVAQAMAGFTSMTGTLTAVITTNNSTIVCTLDSMNAPISVANFVGLARGTRPWLDSRLNIWKTSHFYDGLTWHRILPGFVIQGGDPFGDGTGGPGYDIPNENHAAESLGALAMAAGGDPDAGFVPSGSQFYVVIGTGPAKDYNVFGSCSTEAAIAIGALPHDAETGKPKATVKITKVEIALCK